MRHRLSALSAACGLLLAVQVATARADDPQPPVTPAVPTVAVQVSVSVPNVSVNVQGGIVDISVPGVDVSVSVSSQGSQSATKADASAAQQPTTQGDGAGNCCNAGTKQVAPAGRSMKKARVLRAAPAKRLARPTVRAAANGARARTIRVPPADRSDPLAGREPGSTAHERAAGDTAEGAAWLLRRGAGPNRHRRGSDASRAASRDRASAGPVRRCGGATGRAARGACQGQPPVPPTGSAGGVPLLGVRGGLVLRDQAEASMSTRSPQ